MPAPIEEWKDRGFEVGNYYGLKFAKHSYSEKVGKLVEFLDRDGGYVSAVFEFDGDSKKRSRWGNPGSFYTAEETEDILYHCSWCGEAGHNRRTCPSYAKHMGSATASSASKEEKLIYSRGMRIDPWTEIKAGDLVMVEKLLKDSSYDPRWENMLLEVVSLSGHMIRARVIDNAGFSGGGAFGRQWNFDASNWVFYQAVTERASASEKKKETPLWELIELILPASRLTLLYGPPGTGKTTVANTFGEPNYISNLTLTEETPAAELRGHFVPKGNEFVWMHGPATTEFIRGGRLVLNEIDKASGDALTFCHALLDDPGIAKITLPYTDEEGHPVTIEPHPDFHVVATMNGEPEDLPEALRDRFAVRIMVDKVHPNAIKKLPANLRKIASKGISKDGERSVSIRGWNAFVQLSELVGEENAARAVFGPRAETILNTIKIDSLGKEKVAAK